ncbi:MAG: hypothetical protein ABR923_01860 [Terracidiphilus sp.]
MSRPRRDKGSKTAISPSPRMRRFAGPAIILLAAVIAVSPLLVHGPSCNGDFGFHFISWIDAEHSMSMGILYPHWANSPNFEAGEPKFVFYPPISWMGGAILGALLPWSFVPIAAFILLLTATGLANRKLAMEVMKDGPATLAGCAAIFFGYVLFSVYTRNDFAEMTGGFWIPLLLLFALRRRNPSGTFWERTFDGSAAPLAFIIAGIWLSNVPLGIMAGYLLAALALASVLIEKSMVPVARATASTLGGMGLASIYLIPAIWEKNWASIQNVVNPLNYAVENSWLFARHADPLMVTHDASLHLASIVAVAMLAIAFVGGAIAGIRRVVPGERKWWLPMALIPPAVLFLLFPISQPFWNGLPELRLLQFPWRWLVVLESPMAISFAAAVWFDRKALRQIVIAACAAVFVAISLAAPRWWFVECGSAVTAFVDAAREHIGVLGKPEYAPPGIRFPVVSLLVDSEGNPMLDSFGNPRQSPFTHPNMQIVPDACLLNNLPGASVPEGVAFVPAWRGDPASCDSAGWRELSLIGLLSAHGTSRDTPEEKWFKGVAAHAGYLILRLRYYPAWSVKVNGVPVRAIAERERGLMAVPVPHGNVQVLVDWSTTGDVVAGRSVSGVALLLITCLFLFERKHLRAQLARWASSHFSAENPTLPNIDPKGSVPSVQKDGRNTPSGKPQNSAKRR